MRTLRGTSDPPAHRPAADLIVGDSDWARDVRAQIARVANHDSTVLVTGPTGTGKELIARAIHGESPRSSRPFIPVDCTAISGTLFASQLFGHKKGAYTGAQYEALGCFRAADRGTIFLDEVGELELELQAKLLRVIQERMVTPVGSHEGVPVDVRIVAATNRDLKQEVVSGRFREDLYYRLAVVPIHSAPLRHRTADVPVLADHFLRQLAERQGLPRVELSPGARELLAQFEWPGNVRQLRHFMEQLVVVSDGPIITLPLVQKLLEAARLPEGAVGLAPPPARETAGHRLEQALGLGPNPSGSGGTAPRAPVPLESPRSAWAPASPELPTAQTAHGQDKSWATLQDLERGHIVVTLEHTYYNQSAAARLLGITRQALIRKLKKYAIELPGAVRDETLRRFPR